MTCPEACKNGELPLERVSVMMIDIHVCVNEMETP